MCKKGDFESAYRCARGYMVKLNKNGKAKKCKRRLRVLTLGPLPSTITAGTQVSYQQLVTFLGNRPDVHLSMLNTVGIRRNGLKGAVRFGRLLCRSIAFARKSDVVTLHCSTTALHIMGVTIFLVARLTGKPLIIRKFAGDDYRTTLGKFGRYFAEFVLRHTDLYLVQTQQLVRLALDRGLTTVKWYPTSRPAPETHQTTLQDGQRCLRFVYIGRVCEAKGMHVLAKAAKGLPKKAIIDVYGPWADDLERDVFDGCPKITYCGVLKPEEVIPTMQKYDASLLPTHFHQEGYPGAIVESYFAGLPVIATRWLAIPEIVDESVGILVEPKNADDFLQAMLRLSEDTALFQRLRSKTKAKAGFFSAEHWGDYFVECCRELAGIGKNA